MRTVAGSSRVAFGATSSASSTRVRSGFHFSLVCAVRKARALSYAASLADAGPHEAAHDAHLVDARGRAGEEHPDALGVAAGDVEARLDRSPLRDRPPHPASTSASEQHEGRPGPPAGHGSSVGLSGSGDPCRVSPRALRQGEPEPRAVARLAPGLQPAVVQPGVLERDRQAQAGAAGGAGPGRVGPPEPVEDDGRLARAAGRRRGRGRRPRRRRRRRRRARRPVARRRARWR